MGRCAAAPTHLAPLARPPQKCEAGQQYSVTADVAMVATTADKPWDRPPVRLSFELPGLTASGLRVRFFNVSERSRYRCGVRRAVAPRPPLAGTPAC